MTAVLGAPPPREALKALAARGQTLSPSFHWADTYGEIHAEMLTVAKSAGFDILNDISAALQQRIASGQSTKAAIAELIPILQDKGWWGKALQTDPLTGETRLVQLGSPRRLQLIFDVNMRVSYAAGHWASFDRNKRTLPFLRYVAVLDRKTRPEHAAQNNVTLPVDDPHWDSWAPPCGWNCRCSLQSLSEADVGRMGAKLIRTAPVVPNRSWTNPRTGDVVTLPEGIDPGWGYNPGKAGFRAATAYADKLGNVPPEIAAAAVKSPNWPQQQLADQFAAWVKALADRQDGIAPVTQPSFTVGAIDQTTLDALKVMGIEPSRGAISVDQKAMTHMLRDAKAASGKAVPLDLLVTMPDSIRQPKAVLYDLQDPALLYVFDVPGDARVAKYVVRIDYSKPVANPDGSRTRQLVNSVRTAGLVNASDLSQPAHYRLLSGAL